MKMKEAIKRLIGWIYINKYPRMIYYYYNNKDLHISIDLYIRLWKVSLDVLKVYKGTTPTHFEETYEISWYYLFHKRAEWTTPYDDLTDEELDAIEGSIETWTRNLYK